VEAKRSLVLIGPMGSGKTTVGRLLAEKLGWSFIDTDDLIEAYSGMSISQIFAENGEKYFRRLEEKAIGEAVSKTRTVIATGGGAVTNPANLKQMKAQGVVVYLQTGLEELTKRVGSGKGRPLLSGVDCRRTLSSLLAEREGFYAQGDLVICTDGLEPLEVVDRILKESLLKGYIP